MTASARMVGAATLVRAGQPATAMPALRFVLTGEQWALLAERLRSDPIPVLGLWGDGDVVHALLEEGPDAPLIATVPVEARRVLALSPARPHLAVAERILRDLWGIEAMDALDLRPWFDHGLWKQTAPLSERPGPAAWPPEPPEFLWTRADEAAGAMQWPIGPVQTLIRGPAQLRVTLTGERVRRLEPLMGYAHRGVAFRLRGVTIAEAAALVGRIDAAGCVAHQLAFARAVEMANGWSASPAGRALREAMASLERLAMALRRAELRRLCDRLLEGCAASFGHRLMRDAIGPGEPERAPAQAGLLLLQETASLLELMPDRDLGVAAGTVRRELAIIRTALSGAGTSSFAQSVQHPADGVVEGLGQATTRHGPLWHWVRTEGGRVLSWHAVEPSLSRLSELATRAAGAPLSELRPLFEAADLDSAGADQ